MTKPLLFTVLTLFLLCKMSFAQKDTTAYYMMDTGEVAKNKDSADFVRIFFPPDTALDKNLFIIKDFYMNGKPKMVATSLIRALNFGFGLQGAYVEFFENGHRKTIKNYNKGRVTGDLIEYYPNGKLYNIRTYNAGRLITLLECRDSSGNILAEKGNGKWVKYYDDYKTVYAEGKVKNGTKTDVWTFTNVDGTTRSEEYRFGGLIHGFQPVEFIDEEYSKLNSTPVFKNGIDDFYSFLAQVIRYPAIAREHNIQGKVIVTFYVETNGTLSDIRIIQSVNDILSEETLRVMKLSPPWTPARKNGRSIRSQYTIPVSYSLANN